MRQMYPIIRQILLELHHKYNLVQDIETLKFQLIRNSQFLVPFDLRDQLPLSQPAEEILQAVCSRKPATPCFCILVLSVGKYFTGQGKINDPFSKNQIVHFSILSCLAMLMFASISV